MIPFPKSREEAWKMNTSNEIALGESVPPAWEWVVWMTAMVLDLAEKNDAVRKEVDELRS